MVNNAACPLLEILATVQGALCGEDHFSYCNHGPWSHQGVSETQILCNSRFI